MTKNELFLTRCNQDGMTVSRLNFYVALAEFEKELKAEFIEEIYKSLATNVDNDEPLQIYTAQIIKLTVETVIDIINNTTIQ
jgi:hypothetical protein